MAKRIKMVLYGEPGVGKSVFACKAPKPFFIATDGNYEWLEDFGAKAEDHVQVNSWTEAKDAIDKSYDNYETIVLDLAEDCFKWAEQEYCIKTRIEHISDVGYGKGYDITRNDYFITICKLLAKDKNIILIMHGVTYSQKDRRGVEHTKHAPSSRIPDKILDQIEGRVRYFLRCYLKAEETDEGTLVKRRYLSVVPKENEFGICRGVDETTIPHDIPLDWDEFCKVINFEQTTSTTVATAEPAKRTRKKAEEPVKVEEPTKVEEPVKVEDEVVTEAATQPETTKTEPDDVQKIIPHTEVKAETVTSTPAPTSNVQSNANADRLNDIRAKLAAIKASKN